jgi:predicted outer membrane repeat protein
MSLYRFASGLAIFLLLLAAGPVQAQIYVDADAMGANNGSSWTDAYTDLQDAIDDPDVPSTESEIWVAQGTYTPDNEGDSFTITGAKEGLKIYGGFQNGDTFSERDPTVHKTVLSGDIAGDDNNTTADDVTPTASDIQGDNSHTVVFLDGTTGGPITSDTRIDGVTVTGGQANGDPDDDGGGLFCDGDDGDADEEESSVECAPLLTNVRFIGNDASSTGGAISYFAGSDGPFRPKLRNVVFQANTAGVGGGGIHAEGGVELYVTNAVFSGNSGGGKGGAMYLEHTTAGNAIQPQITNATFVDNETTGDGGGNQFFRQQLAPGPDHRQQYFLAKHGECRGKPNLGE